MELHLKETFTRTRDSLRHTLNETGESLRHRRDEVKQHVENGRSRLIQAEATVLEAAADGLAKARQALGARAAFVDQGEKALREALVQLRAGHAATLPIPKYNDLNVKHATAAFLGLNLSELRTVRAFEVKNKNRVTLLRDLDVRIKHAEAS